MISRILVPNRGEIARRIFRTCRDMGISTVALFSEPDRDEPHAREADMAVGLPGSSPGDTYLDVEAILAAAKETGADAIHPGYGFLSESAEFARAVLGSGITWIGPDPATIESMGSKVAAKRIMDQAGVPTLPSYEVSGGAAVETAGLALGYPLMIKASAGGGGKGMRLVNGPSELRTAIETAEREAFSSFGDNTVFLEKYLPGARHIEVQIFGDSHGNVISLHERECSIQRRHQKIIEECPSPGLHDEARAELGNIAVEAARAVDYVGAGTVEFLYESGRFYFLEMNTRLQVEHPVTEMVTGLDLVRLQIEIADGAELPLAPPPVSGHAIEARLYAEDPVNEFLPTTGRVDRFGFDSDKGLRVDSGVEAGSEISIHYDPMIAKVIAHGPNRAAAASLLASSLRSSRIHGPTTNLGLLVGVLEHPEFLAGDTDTRFLERHDPAQLSNSMIDTETEWLGAVASALADQSLARTTAPVLRGLPSGWGNLRREFQQRSYTGQHGRHDVRYRVEQGPPTIDGRGVEVLVVEPNSVTISVDDADVRFEITRYGTERRIDSSKGPVRLSEIPRFGVTQVEEVRGSLHAPMPGVVIRVDVHEGQRVAEGQVLLVLEAMKMEHALRAPTSGTVSGLRCMAGDQVEGGAVLAVVEED